MYFRIQVILLSRRLEEAPSLTKNENQIDDYFFSIFLYEYKNTIIKTTTEIKHHVAPLTPMIVVGLSVEQCIDDEVEEEYKNV